MADASKADLKRLQECERNSQSKPSCKIETRLVSHQNVNQKAHHNISEFCTGIKMVSSQASKPKIVDQPNSELPIASQLTLPYSYECSLRFLLLPSPFSYNSPPRRKIFKLGYFPCLSRQYVNETKLKTSTKVLPNIITEPSW